MERLKRLEGVVQTLNAQVEEGELEAKSRQDSIADECANRRNNGASTAPVDESVEGLETRFGRLVVDEGRSRYINSSFWASLSTEVEDLKSLLMGASDDESEDHSSPDSHTTSQHQGFVFGYSSTNVDMLPLHPTLEQARSYWEVFKENVDPLIKVVHVPSFEPTLLDAASHPENIPKSLECLVFAVYYAAVTSIMPDNCQERWGETRASLLQKYRFGVEQALARANFLHCDELVVLQAFVIFLVTLRRNEDPRKLWTLTGLVVRIAQTVGIHRDGSHFNLSPFEIEMRRRLWWQVLILDIRASEDHGCDPTIGEAQFDTKMPLNINDTDISPTTTMYPEDRIGFTDMTFNVLRIEICNSFRRILYVPPSPTKCNEFFTNLSLSDKEKWISENHQRLESKYLKDCDMSIPLCWVTATMSRLVMSKMWLIVYHPYQRRDGCATLPQATKDKLFITSLENVEYSLLLETESRTKKWGWLFRTYVQWHALAFLLFELCTRTKGEAVERAWTAIETIACRWYYTLSLEGRKPTPGCLWRPLRKLMDKAREARARELEREQKDRAEEKRRLYAFPQFDGVGGMGKVGGTEKPSEKNLDALLRPELPKAGDVPIAHRPGSPVAERHSLLSMGNGSARSFSIPIPAFAGKSNIPATTINTASTSPPAPISRAAQEFADLSNMGFDYLLRDIMDTTTYEGTDISQHQLPLNLSPPSTESWTNPPAAPMTSRAAFTQQQQQPLDINTYPTTTTTETIDPFNPLNPLMDDTSNETEESPILDDGAMDWTVFDDLVRSQALEGELMQGVGQMGMPTFF